MNTSPTVGAVVISRNDGYGGDPARKIVYALSALIEALDEVIYVDWNSPGATLLEECRALPRTGRLRAITISPAEHKELTRGNPRAQNCVEVLARNIGLRRLTTDYCISTNHDIICLDRESILRGISDERTFHTIARREVHLEDVERVLAHPPATVALRQFLSAHAHSYFGHHHSGGRNTNFGQHQEGSPLGPADQWSLITCPGDFQLAHRNVWEGIRGFEEALVARGYSDSNVGRKAAFYNFGLKLVRDIPVFHLCHYPDSGATGGNTPHWNDLQESLTEFKGTTNPESWGFAGVPFHQEII